MMFACNVVLPDNEFVVVIHSTFDIYYNTRLFGQRGLGSNQMWSLPNLQVATTWSVPFLQIYYAPPNEVTGYDVACQVGKAYNNSCFSVRGISISYVDIFIFNNGTLFELTCFKKHLWTMHLIYHLIFNKLERAFYLKCIKVHQVCIWVEGTILGHLY